jgi:hypothetical protein
VKVDINGVQPVNLGLIIVDFAKFKEDKNKQTDLYALKPAESSHPRYIEKTNR